MDDVSTSFDGAQSKRALLTGDDWFSGGVNDVIVGGDGLDTVQYAGRRADYLVGADPIGFRVDTETFADFLVGVERLLFAVDAVGVALDIDGTGGTAYRLYRAAFDREPDAGGVGFWMAALDRGTSTVEVARNFLTSAEFQSLYGVNPTNTEFVDHLYANVLHRPGDQGGIDFWVGKLDEGFDRALVLAHFADSVENRQATAELIGSGFDYTPFGI